MRKTIKVAAIQLKNCIGGNLEESFRIKTSKKVLSFCFTSTMFGIIIKNGINGGAVL